MISFSHEIAIREKQESRIISPCDYEGQSFYIADIPPPAHYKPYGAWLRGSSKRYYWYIVQRDLLLQYNGDRWIPTKQSYRQKFYFKQIRQIRGMKK